MDADEENGRSGDQATRDVLQVMSPSSASTREQKLKRRWTWMRRLMRRAGKRSEEKKAEKEQSMEDTELKQEFLAALVSLNQELTDLYGDCQGLHSGRDLFGASLMDAKWLEGITKLQR